MQTLFILLLVCILVASVISFAVMGLLQYRRAGALARAANEMDLRFSATDPFDVPRRFAEFAILGIGHSLHASNVTYGRIAGVPVRAFDFRYEAGHGTRRQTRRYGVVVLEMPADLPEALLWNQQDAPAAPPAVRWSPRRIPPWVYTGDEAAARALAEGCRELADAGASVQTRGSAVLVACPARRGGKQVADLLGGIGGLIDRLKRREDGGAEIGGADA